MTKRKTKIDFDRMIINSKIEIERNMQSEAMNEGVDYLCKALLLDSDQFKKEESFEYILEYINKYDRILYAPISSVIYSIYKDNPDKADDLVGTMQTNIAAVMNYSQSETITQRILQEHDGNAQQKLKDTKKAIFKIWDHINLAYQQYSMLKQSDEDYQKQFEKNITPFKDNLTGQLLTIVGIFTALAFLVFGGISSLENVFSNIEIPLFKLMTICSVWGISMLNVIFVFLLCVSKMTKLPLDLGREEKSIFGRYPIIWWSNLILISVMILSMWMYYLSENNMQCWFDEIGKNEPMFIMVIGTMIIIGLIITFAYGLFLETKKRD